MEHTDKINYYKVGFEKHYNSREDFQNKNLCVAILIMGQLRSFFKPEVYNSIIEFVKKMSSSYHVVCFFLVNPKTSFKGAEWKHRCLIDVGIVENTKDAESHLFKKYSEFDGDKELFESIIQKLDCEYRVEYYDDTFFDDVNPIKNARVKSGFTNNSFAYQRKLMRRCNEMMVCYENKNDIKFGCVTKMRPDLKINVSKLRRINMIHQSRFKNQVICSPLDYFRIYDRYIFNFIVDNLESFVRLVSDNIFELPESPKWNGKWDKGWIGWEENLDKYMLRLCCGDLITFKCVKKGVEV
jgi:hypothetical protein